MGQAKARVTLEQRIADALKRNKELAERLAESLERQRIADEKQAQIDLEYRNRMAEARRLRDE